MDSKAEFQFLDFHKPSRTPGSTTIGKIGPTTLDAWADSNLRASPTTRPVPLREWGPIWLMLAPYLLIAVAFGAYVGVAIYMGWWRA